MMKKIFTLLLVLSFVSVCLAGPHHGHHGPSFRRLPPPPHSVHRYSHGHSMHTRDWIGLGAFIFGTSIIANAIEKQPVVVYKEPIPQTIYEVPAQPVVIESNAPIIQTPPPPPPPPPPVIVSPPIQPRVYYYRTLTPPPPPRVIVQPPILILK